MEDTEIRLFAPSNEIFKAFMTTFLPIVLICIFILIWLTLSIVSSKMLESLKRNIIISIICTLFLLHPNLTKQSLGLFECVEIGNKDYRMRMHMDYQ